MVKQSLCQDQFNEQKKKNENYEENSKCYQKKHEGICRTWFDELHWIYTFVGNKVTFDI